MAVPMITGRGSDEAELEGGDGESGQVLPRHTPPAVGPTVAGAGGSSVQSNPLDRGSH